MPEMEQAVLETAAPPLPGDPPPPGSVDVRAEPAILVPALFPGPRSDRSNTDGYPRDGGPLGAAVLLAQPSRRNGHDGYSARSLVPPVPQVFTVDVEEYFQVSAFHRVVCRNDWPGHESRVERSTELLLDLLAWHGATGTFFTLGWIAAAHPALVRRIADAGHEIASHGWSHRKITELTPAEFRRDVERSKDLLEQISGQAVFGFRAPSFSLVRGREWAFDVLLDAGYRYDSSVFPIQRRGYGYPGAPTVPHAIERAGGRLNEFPLTVAEWAGVRIPAAGGGYFRQFPYSVIQRAFRDRCDRGLSGVFYIHPWEVDPDQPRMAVPWLTRVRHYRGLDKTLERLRRLLTDFRFTSISRWPGWAALQPARRPDAAAWE